MALDRNKTGIMAAISAATEGKAPIKPGSARAHRTLPKGTVGSVRAGLGGIQDIPTDQILPWGPQDRLELTAVNRDAEGDLVDLMDSIKTSGQQVPVLLRPAPASDGMFEVIYGRRRILACQELGVPVKALIRTLNDEEALIAKGLENASRQDLSFYERALFAQGILDQGHSRDMAQQALSVSKNTLSQLERVARLVPPALGQAIGPAHGVGRPKWMVLAKAFEIEAITEDQALGLIDAMPKTHSSTQRMEALMETLLSRPEKRGTRDKRPATRSPYEFASVKSTKSSITLTVKRSSEGKSFADWFDANIDRLITDAFQQFKNEAER